MPPRWVLDGGPDMARLTTMVEVSPDEGGGLAGKAAGTPPGGDWDS